MPSTSIIDGRASHGWTTITTRFPANKPPETMIRVPGKIIHSPTAAAEGVTVDLSAMWFVKEQPKPGASASFYAFDILNLKWQQVDRVYVGRQGVKGLVGEVNVVRETRDGVDWTFYLDDHGEPYLIESGDTRMVRQ